VGTVYRKKAPAHLKTVAQLRSSGLQPGDPGVAAGWLERVFDGDVWRTVLYDVGSANPLPASPPRPASPATTPHVAAGAAVSARSDAAVWACDVLQDPDAVVLDTELTDFAGRVIEIAVLATDGTVLLSTLVAPEGAPINHHAQRKHGITATTLAGAPTMAQVWPRLEEVLRGRTVIAWNASFDQARLRAEHQRVIGGAALPEWLARPWECAMRRHAAWAGEPNTQSGGYRNHKLEGGHRAQGDCQAVLDRLRQMASTAPAGTRPTTFVGEVGQSPDLHAIRELWPQVLGEVRGHSLSTAAMLMNAELLSVADRTLVARHASAPLNRRLAEGRNTAVLSEALSAVLGHGWTIRVEPHDAPPRTTIPVEPAPAVEPVPVDESDGEHYHHWQDAQQGMALESWIEIDPGRICDAVTGTGPDASRNDPMDAFYAVNHTDRCAPDATCRSILRLADEDRFDEAMRLAEEHVLGP
jgi:hypothetical protein